MDSTFPQAEVTDFLQNHPSIQFALLFGSITKGKETKELDLIELGRIIAGLENIVDLYKTDPRLAFNIQSHSS